MAEIIGWIVAVGPEMLSGIVMVLSGLVAIALLIPGDQPEKTLQAIVDFLKAFSKK